MADEVNSTVPLIEESAVLGKKRVVTDRITVHTVLETHTEHLRTSISTQAVSVERIPIGRLLDVAPGIRTEGDTTVIPIVEERLIITKQLYLIEEIRVTRSKTTEEIDIPVDLRKQSAVVTETAVRDCK